MKTKRKVDTIYKFTYIMGYISNNPAVLFDLTDFKTRNDNKYLYINHMDTKEKKTLFSLVSIEIQLHLHFLSLSK